MRNPVVYLLGAATIAITLASCDQRLGEPPVAAATIAVDARCTGPRSTRITVEPWNLAVKQNDDVTWTLANSANTDSIIITAKDPANWLFTAQPPYVGKKAAPALGRGMKANARGTYKYNISLICRAGSSRPDTIVIDPDIIVD